MRVSIGAVRECKWLRQVVCMSRKYVQTSGVYSSCTPCGSGGTSPSGSVSGTSCSCPSGFYSSSNGCASCGEGVTSPAGSPNHQGCVCPAGTFHNPSSNPDPSSSPCLSCGSGSVPMPDGTSCSCPANTFFSPWGPNGINSVAPYCISCGGGVSPPNSSYLSQKPCSQCPANTFSNLGSYSGCQACPRGSVSPPGSLERYSCVCPAGLFISSDDCVPCGFGAVAPAGATSGASCACPAGSFATPLDGCLLCGNGGTSPALSTSGAACVCLAGFYSTVLAGCVACPAGSTSPASSTSEASCIRDRKSTRLNSSH